MTSTIYSGSHVGRARKPWSKRKKLIVTGVTAGTIALGGGTAWAAYALFGYGTFNTDAVATANLVVDNSSARLTGQLVPGSSVGGKVNVGNTNDFPVTVTHVLIRNESVTVTAAAPAAAGDQAACESTVHLGSAGTQTTWPGTGGGAATQFDVTEVVIPAGQAREVTVNNVVRQDSSATKLCGVHADFAVRAQTAS